MDENLRFPEYIFTKMATEETEPPVQGVYGSHGCSKRLSAVRGWMARNLLLLVTISGVLLGVVLGFGLRPLRLSPDSVMLISYPGELFMRLLKLMILPLIIASLIAGCARLNATMNGRIAVRTLVYFILTSLVNAILGTVLVVAIHPGDPDTKGMLGPGSEEREARILDGFLDLGRNIFPDNLFQAAFQQAHTVYIPKVVSALNDSSNHSVAALKVDAVSADIQLVRVIRYRAGTNTLGIIFFCLVFGTVLGTMGQKAKVVVEFFTIVDEVIMRMVTGVMWLTPVGISSVICGKILSVGDLSLVIHQLGWFIFTVTLGVAIYQLLIMQLIYFLIIRRNPYKYYWGLVQATLTAFATASTAAALPVTFRCMDEKVKVDPRISRFILPIGCTINMNGTALFVAVASIFIAQMNEIQLGLGEILTVCLASTAASFSSASVPSAALVLIFMVLSTIDAPAQDVSLLFAIDWFVDRIRTTNNMLGDCYAAAVVEHLSKQELASASSWVGQDQVLPSNGHAHTMQFDDKPLEPEAVVVDCQTTVMNGNAKKV